MCRKRVVGAWEIAAEAAVQSNSTERRPWMPSFAVIAAVAVGAALRLAHPEDIEYKFDEAWTYNHAHAALRTTTLPLVGMRSSAGVINPGASVWLFVALDRLFAVEAPPDLARAVQVLNILALVLLTAFAWRWVPTEEREPWLWGTALVSLNPLAILFHRKIWPPSCFPFFVMLFLMAWSSRSRRGGALAWGALGALLGQLQMGGFFFALAFVGWAALFGRREVRWGAWLVGSCLGAVPLWPWLCAVLVGVDGQTHAALRWWHALECRFWLHFFSEPIGLTLTYTLGKDFGDFLSWPLVEGRGTYLVAVLHGVIIAAGTAVFGRAVRILWQKRARWGLVFRGVDSPTAFTQNAALWGYGCLMTLSLLPVHRHYLIILFPLPFVWLARAALAQPVGERNQRPLRSVLAGLCVAQALLSLCLISYVHSSQRLIRGDYGTPYGAQQLLVVARLP
jgi:hypothetical protein